MISAASFSSGINLKIYEPLIRRIFFVNKENPTAFQLLGCQLLFSFIKI